MDIFLIYIIGVVLGSLVVGLKYETMLNCCYAQHDANVLSGIFVCAWPLVVLLFIFVLPALLGRYLKRKGGGSYE